MPTYEYLCRNCGQQFEVFQSFKDKPLKTHAECGGEVQKVFHASGVVFKGSGFYVTDSRGKKASKSTSDSGSGGSDSAAGESKPSKDSGSSAGSESSKAAASSSKSSSSSGTTGSSGD